MQGLLEQHLQVSVGWPQGHYLVNYTIHTSKVKSQRCKVSLRRHLNISIYSLPCSLSLSTCIWVWGEKKSQFSRKHPPPCPINPFLFPQATSTQKETANQIQIILWVAARRGMGDGVSSCWNPAPPPVLSICASCWQASKQINGAQPQASLASQASSLTHHRAKGSSHHHTTQPPSALAHR